MARQGNPISVRLDLNRCSDSSWFCDYYYGKLVYQDVNLRSYFGSIRPPTHLTFGFRLGRLIILHFPKRTFIHFLFPRRVFPKRRKKTRPGKTKGRGAGKRVESTRRAKQNDRSLWKIKKKGYGYHDRSPSIKKNLSKLLWVSGTFKHPKYAGVVVNDDSFGKTKLFKCFFERKSRSDDPTSDLLKRTFPAVRPSLNYSVMQYLLNRKNKMHFDPVVVLMNFVAPGVAEPSTMGRANAHGRSLDKRIRNYITFFVESFTSEKKCLAEDKKTFFHFIRQANDLFFAGTTKTTISLFPFLGATFLFLRDGVGVYNSLFFEKKKLLGQLKQKYFYHMKRVIVDQLKQKCFNINREELRKGTEMIIRVILRKRKNSYLNKVKNMQSLLSNRTNTNTLIEPVKIKSVYQSASLIAQYISFQLRKKKRSFRSIFSKVVKDIPFFMKKKGMGIRICCSGRLKGAEIARTECGKYGKISRNVFNQKIDYALAEVSTRYGILGVKVWISYNNKKTE